MTERTAPGDIVPAEYPELALLVWNGDPTRPIPGVEALALYERNWRHIDPQRLTPREAGLIRALADAHGHGRLLVSGVAPW